MNRKERIEGIQKQLREKSSKGLVDDAIAICRTAVNEFPNDYRLLNALAFYLSEKDETKKEAISINERILADCTDDDIRYAVMQGLAFNYKSIGEKEKAIETAHKLPTVHTTSDVILSLIHDGEKRVTQIASNIEKFTDLLQMEVEMFARAKYSDDKEIEGVQKRIELLKKAISLFEIIYENGDYGFYTNRMKGLCLSTASNYMLLDDFGNALDWIEKAAGYAIAFDTMPEVFTHTSIISNGNEFSKAKNLTKNYNYNISCGLLQNLSNERYNPIRETERFKAVVAKLEQYASKE